MTKAVFKPFKQKDLNFVFRYAIKGKFIRIKEGEKGKEEDIADVKSVKNKVQ